MQQILDYKIIPTGRSKDLSNQQFGDYLALYRTENPSSPQSQQTYWLCQCVKCKHYYIKPSSTLLKGVNKCECNYNLVGKVFGRWTVQFLCEKRAKNRGKIYHCICECGNEKDVPADTLLKGESKSCGCLRTEKIAERCRQTRIDLTGQRFGKLIALYPIYTGDKNRHTIWHCKCDCGNECEIDMGNLRAGRTQSCGCAHSLNEEKIIKLLSNAQIPFSYQHRFKNFATKKFDFFVNNEYIIEFDGKQHFSYTGSGWDTEEHYLRIHTSDLEKDRYCFNNNIPIIRIPYDTIYTLDDLKIETTRFLLTPENEVQYYK